MGKYIVLNLKGVRDSDEESLNDLVFSFGAQGISEVLSYRQTSQSFEPETISTPFHDINVYFLETPHPDLLQTLRTEFGDVKYEIREEEEKDWLEEWKKGFEPFPLASDLWIIPRWWKNPPEEASKKILMEPGMAFGTGTHATTQLAAEFLSQLDLKNISLLDVGTGTGVLAMAAALQGASRILGTEIDSQARLVAKENLRLNGLENIEILEEQIESINEKFGVVVANIIDGILLDLKFSLMDRVAGGGDLILTGILLEREPDFVAEFNWSAHLFTIVERREKEGWVGYHLKRSHT